MLIGFNNLAKAQNPGQCPGVCANCAACSVEYPCVIYQIHNATGCNITGITAFTTDACDGCNTTQSTNISTGWTGQQTGTINGDPTFLGVSHISNDCGCFCMDGFSWNGGASVLTFNATPSISGSHLIPVSTSCCASGYAEVFDDGYAFDFCPTGWTCPAYQSYRKIRVECH